MTIRHLFSALLLGAIGALSVACGPSGCGAPLPNAESCLPWDQLQQQTRTPPTGRMVVQSPGVGRTYAGLYSIGDVENGLETFTSLSQNRSPPIVFTFHDWVGEVDGGGFDVGDRRLRDFESAMEGESMTPLELMAEVSANGGVAAFAWDALGYYIEDPGYYLGFDTRPVRHEDILNGMYDGYIRHVAGQIRDSGLPVMLSALGEFGVAGHASYGAEAFRTKETAGDLCNQYGDPGWPDGPERIRDLFRHVIDIFTEEGATNVTWFMYASTGYMNPAASDFSWEHPGYYYAGDDYIDWIGNSLYFTNDPALTNADVGDLSYALDEGLAAWREVTDRPFFAPEFGMSTTGQQSAADFLERTLAALPGEGVAAFTYADAPLFQALFSIPRLGTFDDEREVWNAALDEDAYATSALLADSVDGESD